MLLIIHILRNNIYKYCKVEVERANTSQYNNNGYQNVYGS